MTQKKFFEVVGTRTAHPGHIGAYCTIFNFSAKPNTFFKQIKFQTVDRHNAGKPVAHALTHGARTTARRRAKDPVPARYRCAGHYFPTLSQVLSSIKFPHSPCLRPYHLEYTSSRPITEVKQG